LGLQLTGNENSSIGQSDLFVEKMRRNVSAGRLDARAHKSLASISFVHVQR
jgi:hypothetical protein